jgi:citrate synthase
MGFFSGHKIKKLEEQRQIEEMIPLLHDKSPDTAREAHAAFFRTAARLLSLPPRAEAVLVEMTKSAEHRERTEAWKALLHHSDPRWMPLFVELLEAEPAGPLAELAFRYFDTVRAKDPDHVRRSLAANARIRAMIKKDLTGDLLLTSTAVQRAYRFVELFDLWSEAEIAEKTKQTVLNTGLKALDPALRTLLVDAMSRLHPEDMTRLFIAEWDEQFGTSEFNETMARNIKTVGRAAIPVLQDYVNTWLHGIQTMRSRATVRDAKYEISRWAIFLIGEMAPLHDEKLVEWLFDISIDTKLADTGAHRKAAREAIDKIRDRAA